MTVVRIEAQSLRPGDVLAATGAVILNASAGVSTPRGKVDVIFRRKDGSLSRGCWGKTTTIGVRREPAK